jgi:hypothetical protein
MRRLRVHIDLSRLAANLSAEDHTTVSDAQARQFLLDAGFAPAGDGWLVNECDLGQVEPAEVTSIEDFEEPAPSAVPPGA